ncbi:beta family protein [Herminiimonas arsenitoxidans]|uniref:beta family protein n=1 Tax=Herminiimonas arsenitoxidans TaxID=1809410 RepID=UPI000970EA90|nr:beta family protein [Herminiimonas arsenitoxidans]
MGVLYVPILAAKLGEFSALAKLSKSSTEQILPVFEIPKPKDGAPIEAAIAKTAVKTGKVWSGREAFMDIMKWKPNARTESGIHVLEFAFTQLRAEGVIAHPVVSYDRWDDHEYSLALKNIRLTYPIKLCIRLEAEALEDMGDFPYFKERLDEIMSTLDIVPSNCYILVDLGNVAKSAVPDVLATAELAIDNVRALGFTSVILAGSSMASSINEAVSKPDTTGCIPRIEMMAWKAIFASRNDKNIIFGDYAVRSANAADGIITQYNNAKIRYTINNQFFIVRGRSKHLSPLGKQNQTLAQRLVASQHYMGAGFSWGDAQIMECSLPNSREMGSPTTWIGIDSNHHIHAVIAEIFEFQQKITTIPQLAANEIGIARKN